VPLIAKPIRTKNSFFESKNLESKESKDNNDLEEIEEKWID
jgi:hypothetical protein